MASERWRRIEALFEEALQLAAGERRVFLDRACGDDRDLRLQVESLLEADGEAEGFLAEPAAALRKLAEDREPAPGRAIGPYRLVREIGAGGMGTVYLAVRDDDAYRQEVAVKVFAYGRERPDLVRRFRTERQILAALEHPSIARLLDGGATAEGLPYLVMEAIEGEPIDRYCDRRQLPVGERIELFRALCAAVHYAHQSLVVHRDIKPSNVLVTAAGVPKLLDFGIAKLVDPEGFPQTVEHTATGQRLMTPQYASPEQVEGAPVTTASDVYSLGVLLFRLLTGHLPYRGAEEQAAPIERAVVEEEPQRPSAAVSRIATVAGGAAGDDGASAVTPEAVSRARATAPERLRRQLAGDLDNIVLKALRKEPQRRYGSVLELDEDLRRYQEGLPVAARPDTLGYRAGKFVRRHRLGVAMTAALFLATAGAAVFMSLERDKARRERDKARAVAAFLEEIFEVSDPSQARGESVTAREILDRGAERIARELVGEPEIEAALAGSIGNVYRNLGLYDRAEPHLRRSLELRRRLAADHPELADSRVGLARLLRDRGELDAAEELLRQALAARRRAGGAPLADTLHELGEVLGMKGDLDAAETALRESLALRRGIYGGDDEHVADSLGSLCKARREQGDLDAAEELCREALSIERRFFGELHPRLASRLNDLAIVHFTRGDLEEAGELYGEAVGQARRLYGDVHPQVALLLNNLAVLRGVQGDYEAAEPLFRQVLELRRELLGDEHPEVAQSLANLGRLRREQGDLDAAEEHYRESIRILERGPGDPHPWLADYRENLALLLRDRGDYAAAEPLLRSALALRRELVGAENPRVGSALAALGDLLTARGAAAEAEPQIRQGLEILRSTLGDGHWRTAQARSLLGACLGALGRYQEAEPLALAGYETLAEQRGPDNRLTAAARERVIALYEAWGRPREAERFRAPSP